LENRPKKRNVTKENPMKLIVALLKASCAY